MLRASHTEQLSPMATFPARIDRHLVPALTSPASHTAVALNTGPQGHWPVQLTTAGDGVVTVLATIVVGGDARASGAGG